MRSQGQKAGRNQRGRLLEGPSTSWGQKSLLLVVAWMVFLLLGFGMIVLHGGVENTRRISMAAGGHFYSVPTVSIPVTLSVVAGLAGLAAALAAVVRKGERSLTMILPVVIGALVLLIVVGEMME